ncbi:hypothetical protein ATO6_09200 [Oceanicola sp. 22II-s10i]|uniref:metallophosphoesterase family protein n=1 Tax=Oceanicola sp. 22II-s10i TaxID=1317116 RepID=UPI000B527D29|nr:metallophosphoesterase [Oceanicola sp. 22II-s10i]OWU85201.1 hypothetical protein ATO6_09200 [Oceanicola sp. 22II-s10i]
MTDDAEIPALVPDGAGHSFVLYGDACSGVPGAPHEATHRAVNAVVARLRPAPEFIVFPGDEIIGLTDDMDALRAQWRHWLDHEMAWLDRARCPVYHATGNHTTYSAESEAVFAEMLPHLPRNGPEGQAGLSYVVRRGDLVMVFVHTLDSGLGGEGHLDTGWVARALAEHDDARWKFVIGHHPALTVNGFAGAYARTIGPDYVEPFWRILRDAGVTAYLCSHILAFDVQAREGVLQITTAGAGTAHRMPEGIEYLHAVQVALDAGGMRYQVLDTEGAVRERLAWPLAGPDGWTPLVEGAQAAPISGPCDAAADPPRMMHLRLRGEVTPDAGPARQTLLAASDGAGWDPLWIGLTGASRRLTITLQPQAGRSPHYWFGPDLEGAFDLTLALHGGMGPGGILWRQGEGAWSSCVSAASWGLERLDWPATWHLGARPGGREPFRGTGLGIAHSGAGAA